MLRASVLAAGLAATWAWQWLDYRDHVAEHRAEHRRFGEAILGAADGAILRHCRRGGFDPDELAETLADVRAGVDANWIALLGPDGTPLAEAGATGGEATRFERPFESPRPRGRGYGRGRGAEDLVPFPASARLVLERPRAELDARLAGDLRRFLTTGAALSAAVLLGYLLLGQRLRALRLALRLESVDYLGRLGAGLAHETKNPLGVVRGRAQRLLERDCAPEERERAVRAILEETDRTLARLDEFLLLSRPAELRRTRFALRPLLEQLADLVRPDLDGRGASIRVEGEDRAVDADREQVRRMFLNVLLNAVAAVGEGGTIRVAVRGDGVRITDDGCGVPAALRATLFEPYVTGREDGTGLGLAIARRIATGHGWRLSHEPAGPRGTTMVVEIPKP